MVGPVMRAMMVHSSGHEAFEEPVTEVVPPFLGAGDASLGPDIVLDSLDSGFALPPPAVGVFEDNPVLMEDGGVLVLPEDLHELDWVDIESTALDQSSRVSTVDDETIATSMLTPKGSMLSTAALRLVPAFVGTVPEEGNWNDVRVLVVWGLKVRRELRTLDYLLQHWAALTCSSCRVVCVDADNTVGASTHRQHTQAPVECAHRVGGRRVALRSSRRGALDGKRPPRISPAARRSAQQACAVRQMATVNRVNREALEHYRRVLRGSARASRGLLP
jgi:hypothetical protein